MALIKCSECGTEISDQAVKCPSCGAKVIKKATTIQKVLAGAVVCMIIYGVSQGPTSQKPATLAQTPSQVAEKSQSDAEFSAGVFALKDLRNGQKDPNSFELEDFLIFPGGATCYEYFSRNSFNAKQRGLAIFDPKSRQLLVRELHGKRFVNLYNQICTQGGGKNRTDGVKAISKAWS